MTLLLQKYPAITANKWQIKALPGVGGGSFYFNATSNIKLIARFAGKNERLLGVNRQSRAQNITSAYSVCCCSPDSGG